MLHPNMTDGQAKEFELVDFAENLKNIQKDFINESFWSCTCLDQSNFLQKDDTF